VIAGGGGAGGGRGGSETSAIATWLAEACPVVSIGGTSVYDCAGAT
jgi:hypothetical protein